MNAGPSLNIGWMRRLILLSLSCWICFAIWSGVFYWFWRSEVSWPHGGWAVVSLGSMIALAVCLGVACFIQILRDRFKPNRNWLSMLGWFLIGTAPLAWFGGHWLDSALSFRQRLPRPTSGVNRVCQTWLCSFFDAVSRLKFCRSSGRHVVLFHPEDYLNTERLTRDMDRHIVAMAELLGVQVPGKVAWVRGPMVSSTGVAVGSWAVTGAGQDPNQLTSLDRHEVAHSVITELCSRYHNPPRLFVEGWAQSRSEDRSELIRQLARDYQFGGHFYLDELIEDPFYSASRWPMYQYGGPFVLFLVERFSGEQFLQLYSQVRQQSFRTDVARVLGVDWKELEAEFWVWLESEANKIDAEQAANSEHEVKLEFADDVPSQVWSELTGRYSETQWSENRLPTNIAFEVKAMIDEQPEGERFERKLQAVFEGDQYWLTYHNPESTRQYVMMRDHSWANLERDHDGVVTGTSGGIENLASVRGAAHHLMDLFRNAWDFDPGRSLPLSSTPLNHVTKVRIMSLKQPTADDDRWRVKYRKWIVDQESPEETITSSGTIWMHGSNQLAVVKHIAQLPRGDYCENEIHYRRFGGVLLAEQWLSSQRNIDSRATFTSRVTTRQLSDREAAAVKQVVENEAASVDTTRPKSWFEYVWLLTCSQPITGLFCVCLGTRRSTNDA